MKDNVDVVARHFEDDGVIPNNPDLPVVILKAALDPALSPAEVQEIHRRNGWGGGWVYTVFDYHHWHPDAHEALSVAAGAAELMLGGPGGEVFRVEAGDTLVLPAGTGHRRLSASPDFAVCGCYPPGQESYSTRRGVAHERGDGPAEVARVPRPETDPVFGADGPLIEAWRR
ncbi:cupin domain-containing protein [Psychromarinibacter sp. C21-152]|uniref:Cupin domain-containing protein n=1 Tax=Psychromarinibacter sediminicola TaxID=3033385 RepID=A0AAE3T6V4_9RHOB|nr:cupin domain-containing protein [Psychromarinibacter sediminicola]MDF0599662.1 cupin domain-containing protein [Psychromarinibacter sediminicola]